MVNNPKQEKVIHETEGILVVDAGPGTGKTYSITKRYLEIFKKKEITEKDILLLTFTNSAADNMKEKIVNELIKDDPNLKIQNLQISTFHSFCKKLLNQGCENLPSHLGIKTRLNQNFLLENNPILENNFFMRLYKNFKKNNSKYSTQYSIIGQNELQILSLIKKLFCKGIFPNKTGWFLDRGELLLGNDKEFYEIISEINVPGIGKTKPTQSDYLSKFKISIKDKFYYDCPPDFSEDKIVNIVKIHEAFIDDRTDWINFVHDIYFYYIEQSIKENKLTFNFLIMFAFLELYYNKNARTKNSFEYVMVDEFQDTNELQFMITLLLMKKNNLCVVGDWKQGIYEFRNATIDNIIEFKKKIKQSKKLLNKNEKRIHFDVESKQHEFVLNFRSSQNILDFSNYALASRGSKSEQHDIANLSDSIVKLTAHYNLNETSEIKFYKTEDKELEIKFILQKIEEIVKSEKIIKEHIDGSEKIRKIEYSDITVLTRTGAFGIELQKAGLENKIPIDYDGGVQLFRTKEAILLLAALRIFVDEQDEKGWITLLEYENYSLANKKEILEIKEYSKKYPEKLLEFRKGLFKFKKNMFLLVSQIFKHFNIKNNISNEIIKIIGEVFSSEFISVQKLIAFIENNIKENITYSIDINKSENAVTVQTIHNAKGLEYPVVFIANCNERQFPSFTQNRNMIYFNDILGLRCSKEYKTKNGYTAKFDSWKTYLVKSAMTTKYDEERRLLFVAITRAKQYLYFTASKPSQFFEELLEKTNEEPEIVSEVNIIPSTQKLFEEDKEINLKIKTKNKSSISPHDLMDEKTEKIKTTTEKKDRKLIGKKVHFFAEKLAKGIKVEEEIKNNLKGLRNIENFLKKLKANELKAEAECSLTIENEKVIIRGIIDLIVILDDKIQIIDYKTDEYDKKTHQNYVKQISVYFYAVKKHYQMPVECKIFYVSEKEPRDVDPVSENDLKKLVKQKIKKHSSP